jgi:hypothetical protein
VNRCKLIECLGKTRCNACMAMDAAYPPAVDDKELARFVSETIAHGIGLALIYKGMPAADLVAQVTAERVAMFRALTPNAKLKGGST